MVGATGTYLPTNVAAFVYTRNGDTGEWERTDLTPPAGWSVVGVSDVAVSGGQLLIGYDGHSGWPTPSGAFPYTKVGSRWVAGQPLTLADPPPFDSFGSRVSLAGDRAIVSAPREAMRGAAYFYERSGNQWIRRQKVLGTEPVRSGVFLDEPGAERRRPSR